MMTRAQIDDKSGIPKIAVVVPTFNRKDVTLKFLESIRQQSADIPIYVCDSGSTDGTVQTVSSMPGVNLIGVGCDAWWSAAVNRGIDQALADGHDAVLIMNDDIELDFDLLARLGEKRKSFPRAIVSPLQASPTGLFLGTYYTGWSKRVELVRCAEEDVFVDTTNGCCLLVPKEVFYAIGKFNEIRCPHQYGDTEFQLRAKSAGFPTVACPAIKISQLEATNYYARLRLGSMLNFAGSPLHFPAYAQFGATLFGGHLSFYIFGVQYHYRYIKTLAKAVLHLAKKTRFLR
jgi:GT2 family glycosyltransferase